MALTKERLLIPRYKLIADYPGNGADIGTIFSPEYYVEQNKDFYDRYPHLFRKMEWHEDREESDMPKYVKGLMATVKDKFFKVCDRDQNGRAFHNDTEIELAYLIKYGNFFLPATEEEFNSQKQ